MKLVFATNNAHKLKEVRQLLGTTSIEIVNLKDIGCFDDIPETGNTLEENARIKAQFIYQKYGLDCFADDTGLEVECLNNAPGVYSARYAGASCDSKANMEKLLVAMGDSPNRNAQFRTIIALIYKGNEYTVEGNMRGSIALHPKGVNGFGYDPIFVPKGSSTSISEMSDDEKNAISHRAKAIQSLVSLLKELSS